LADDTNTVTLEVEAPEVEEPVLSSFVDSFLLAVFDEVITGEMHGFIVRQQFIYQGPPLDGEYWLPGRSRVAPHPVTEGLRPGSWVSQILIIDQEIDAIDEDHAWAVASDRAETMTAWLSLILDIGLRIPPGEWLWTYTDEWSTEGSWRYWAAPRAPRFLKHMPKRGSESSPGEWTGRLHGGRDGGRKLSFPREARRILRFAETAPERLRTAFDGCCRLYQLSNVLPHEFVSAKLALRVAAVEALTKATEKGDSFSAFMRARSPLVRSYPDLLDVLYGKLRSGLFHAGQLYFNNETRTRSIGDFEAARRRDEEARGEGALRDAIIVWLRENIIQNSD
jgi:hypothetical protein